MSQLDHSKIAGILGASEVRFTRYAAEEQPGGSWAVWDNKTHKAGDPPLCRVAAGKGFHTKAEARRIAVKIAQALNASEPPA